MQAGSVRVSRPSATLLAIHAMPHAALVARADARVVAVNRAAEDLTGLKAGADVHEALHPEDYGALSHALSSLSRVGAEPGVVEHRVPVRWRASPGARYHAALSSWRLLKGASLVTILPHDDGLFRAMADTAPMLVWTSGLDGNLDFLNAAWLAFTGRSLARELGAGWMDGVHPEDALRCFSAYEKSFAARAPFEMDFRLRRFDGQHRWLLDKGAPRFDANNEFLGFIGSCVDITEYRSMQAALQAALGERTRDLQAARAHSEALATLGDALTRADSAESVASSALETLGPVLRARQMLFTRLEGDLLRPVHAWGNLNGPLLERFKLAQQEPAPAQGMTLEIIRSAGAHYTTNYAAEEYAVKRDKPPGAVGGAPVLDEHGRVHAIISVERDTSAGPWTPEERDLMRRAAETVAQALARQRGNARLVLQAQALQARNAEQETFIYTVSHDLRAPLLAIRGMGELLEGAIQRRDDQESAFLLSRVNANAERMERQLLDLLNLSRAARDTQPVTRLDLNELLTGILADLSARVNARALEVVLAPDWPGVLAAPGDAYHLLCNLIGNAVKYAQARVELSWSRDGDTLLLHVDDDGPGIPEAFRERVFELFQQAPNANQEGTGVGLAIVKRITQHLGGQVTVGVSPLGGARLSVSLPNQPA